MKLLTEEEIEAQQSAVIAGGVKGALFGSCISLGIYAIAPRKFPKLFQLSWSIKTCVAIIPPMVTTVIAAETASNEFDNKMYSSEYEQKKTLAEHRRWKSLTTMDKTIEILSNNRYKIIFGVWLLSLYGSWLYANRDKMLSKSQKLYVARMYAQFLTVILLLGSVSLSFYEEQHPEIYQLKNALENDSWKAVINEEEQREKILKDHPEIIEKQHYVRKHLNREKALKETTA